MIEHIPAEFNVETDRLSSSVGNGTEDNRESSEEQFHSILYCESSEPNVKKMNSVLEIIHKDPKAADIKCSLYFAAFNSYRYTSCLHPYPPEFIHDNKTTYHNILQFNETIPPLRHIPQLLIGNMEHCKRYSITEILYWLLVELKEPTLVTVPKCEHDSVLRKVSDTINVQKPLEIFKLTYNQKAPIEIKWNRVKKGFNTQFGFHGSRLDNFHSILHYGLCQNFSKKESLFGPGIYLSSELGISLHYSQSGFGWKQSAIGEEISVIALVEFVNHPVVLCHPDSTNLPTSDSQEIIPIKYYVVPNSDLVRVRYLLVYVTKRPSMYLKNYPGLIEFLRKNKMLLLLFAYIALLISLGLSNNVSFTRFLKVILQKLSN